MTSDSADASEPRVSAAIVGSEFAAGLGRRLAARCIDTALRGLLFYVAFALHDWTYESWFGPGYNNPSPEELLVPAVLYVILMVYEPLIIARTGRTLGKLLLGIGVVRLEDVARAPGFARSVMRWAIPAILGAAILWIASESIVPLLPAQPDGEGGASMLAYVFREDFGYLADDIWMSLLMHATLFGAVAGVPLGSGVLCLAGLRCDDRRGWHDRTAGTIVVRLDAAMRDRLAASESIRARR